MLRTLVKGILLSILIFFSISFLTVLFQLYSPLNRIEGRYELRIGFPLEYYYELMLDCQSPNYGWNGKNLLFDCGLIWVITMIILMIRKKM